jgi:hypothetical protein
MAFDPSGPGLRPWSGTALADKLCASTPFRRWQEKAMTTVLNPTITSLVTSTLATLRGTESALLAELTFQSAEGRLRLLRAPNRLSELWPGLVAALRRFTEPASMGIGSAEELEQLQLSVEELDEAIQSLQSQTRLLQDLRLQLESEQYRAALNLHALAQARLRVDRRYQELELLLKPLWSRRASSRGEAAAR